MSWKNKIQEIVEGVLNTLLKNGTFKLHIIDEHSFSVTEDDKFCLRTETLEYLPAHWKRFARTTIDKIIEVKINNLIIA